MNCVIRSHSKWTEFYLPRIHTIIIYRTLRFGHNAIFMYLQCRTTYAKKRNVYLGLLVYASLSITYDCVGPYVNARTGSPTTKRGGETRFKIDGLRMSANMTEYYGYIFFLFQVHKKPNDQQTSCRFAAYQRIESVVCLPSR